MKLPYDEYRGTNHYWLQEIPSHWDNAPLRLISRRYSGGTPDKKNSGFWQDGTIPWLNSGAVNQELIKEPTTHITVDALKQSSAKWIPTNAIIIALAGQGKTKGTAALTCFKTTCNQSMAAVIFEKDSPKFMYWWLKSQYKNIRGMASDDGRDGLNLEMIGSIPCPMPPIDEQTQIAKFLYYKTAQIDRLIEKKKALIEKLNEQRIALITQAVTKGLNPDAPMKDSEVDWLGEVPEHWETRRLKLLAKEPLKYGANEAASRTDRSLPRYIRITDVKEDGSLYEETFRSLENDLAEPYLLQEGDILLARSGATVGKCFQYGESWGQAAYAGYLIRFRTDEELIDAKFAYYFLRSSSYWANINSTLIQSTIQNFSAEKYGNILVPLPPVKEQREIVHFIKEEQDKLDSFYNKANEVIFKFEEYRTALITAAVTGKIDVREINVPEKV